MKDAEDVICALQQQVSYAQDNINESQMGIVQVEENRVSFCLSSVELAFLCQLKCYCL